MSIRKSFNAKLFVVICAIWLSLAAVMPQAPVDAVVNAVMNVVGIEQSVAVNWNSSPHRRG